jgi:DNA-binding beta-propeller fold protein YncE
LPSLVWPQVSDPTGIAVDPSGGKLYWCQNTGNDSRILSSNLDGSSPAPIVSWPQVLDPKAISVDVTNARIYWAQGASTTTKLVRANLDGSAAATIVGWPQASDVVGLDAVVGPAAPIPTVSQWGLLVMVVVLLTAATVVLRVRTRLEGVEKDRGPN